MKKTLVLKWFTLVELLVVITILAIISVVAYQNFGGAVDKAVSGRKINDVSTIETALQQFKVDNNYYPSTATYSGTTNMWGYNSTVNANPSNTIDVTLNWAEITAITAAIWGWKVMNNEATPKQIGAKWTISQEILSKKYLTKDLYDPEVWDLSETTGNKKLIEFWLWRYVYAVYKKPTSTDWGTNNKTWTYYNIAYSVKKEGTDTFVTKIVWDYDNQSCFETASFCPKTLIWSWNNILIDWQELWKDLAWSALANYGSTQANQWIPYPVSDFE